MTGNSVDVGVGAKRKRKRVLLLAYACSPYKGSEAGVGWNRAFQTAKYFDTWVICEKHEFENAIIKFLKDYGEIPTLHFHFVPRPSFERFLWKLPGLNYVAYNIWHRRAYRLAAALHKKLCFDLAHQANMCGFREPGYLLKLDIPFIWGPVGGTQNYPWRFLTHAGIRGATFEALRTVVNRLQLHFSPRVHRAVKKAVVILTANSENKRDFEQVHHVKPVLFLEIGIETVKNKPSEKKYQDGALRILWSGEFIHRKALQLLLLALNEIPHTLPCELRILGRGPLEKRWKRLALRLGIDSYCNWMGWLPYDQAMAQYNWADVFVFTSLRDTAGTVVLEALSKGVPVICLDHQGVGDIITDDCGFKIPVTTPREVISCLRDTIVCLVENRARLLALSWGAMERAREYLWSRNGKQMAEIYEKVFAAQTDNEHEQHQVAQKHLD